MHRNNIPRQTLIHRFCDPCEEIRRYNSFSGFNPRHITLKHLVNKINNGHHIENYENKSIEKAVRTMNVDSLYSDHSKISSNIVAHLIMFIPGNFSDCCKRFPVKKQTDVKVLNSPMDIIAGIIDTGYCTTY